MILSAQVRSDGSRISWVEVPGEGPARVYVHGLGGSSAPAFARTVADPALAGRRSLLVDLLGFGLSDRPADAAYTVEEHADQLAAALIAAEVGAAQLIGHSMGGSVAIVLAGRHPALVGGLVLVDANLDPVRPSPDGTYIGSASIARYTEDEFLDHGWDETLSGCGPLWASTMRMAGREALHRSAVHLVRATTPTMREILLKLTVPRTLLYPAARGKRGADELAAAGVRMVGVPECGHNIMLDNPEAFVAEILAAER